MAKSSFKGKIERLFARYNALSFVSSVKGAPAYRKQFLYAALAMVKKLGIPTYFAYYRRYVDDIFVLFRSPDHLEKI